MLSERSLLYIELVESFLSKEISVECFEYAFVKFSKERRDKYGSVFRFSNDVLNTLFLDVEEFCSDPELIDENDIDEEELRRLCSIALKELKYFESVGGKIYKVYLISYANLITDYINEKISFKCFEYVYKTIFMTEYDNMEQYEFEILNLLKLEIDELKDNEKEFRNSCRVAYDKLAQILEVEGAEEPEYWQPGLR